MDRLQSHIWLTASSYMFKYLRISSYIRNHILICDFETDPICFLSYQCTNRLTMLVDKFIVDLSNIDCAQLYSTIWRVPWWRGVDSLPPWGGRRGPCAGTGSPTPPSPRPSVSWRTLTNVSLWNKGKGCEQRFPAWLFPADHLVSPTYKESYWSWTSVL